MNNNNQNYLLLQLEQIINSSRSGDESFFTDGKKAATEIIKFLESENLLAEIEPAIEINYSAQYAAYLLRGLFSMKNNTKSCLLIHTYMRFV
jgi:hypothetical protein